MPACTRGARSSPSTCVDGDADLELLQRSVNKMLGPAVVVRDAAFTAPDFDARHSAIGRRYRYTVLNTPVPDPFSAKTAWHVETPLDLRAMQLACDPLIGEHDFQSFCRQPSGHDPGPLVRRVASAGWVDLDDGPAAVRHRVQRLLPPDGAGPCRHAGGGRAWASAGPARWPASSERKRRSAAGQLAPPHGLCLWEVLY